MSTQPSFSFNPTQSQQQYQMNTITTSKPSISSTSSIFAALPPLPNKTVINNNLNQNNSAVTTPHSATIPSQHSQPNGSAYHHYNVSNTLQQPLQPLKPLVPVMPLTTMPHPNTSLPAHQSTSASTAQTTIQPTHSVPLISNQSAQTNSTYQLPTTVNSTQYSPSTQSSSISAHHRTTSNTRHSTTAAQQPVQQPVQQVNNSIAAIQQYQIPSVNGLTNGHASTTTQAPQMTTSVPINSMPARSTAVPPFSSPTSSSSTSISVIPSQSGFSSPMIQSPVRKQSTPSTPVLSAAQPQQTVSNTSISSQIQHPTTAHQINSVNPTQSYTTNMQSSPSVSSTQIPSHLQPTSSTQLSPFSASSKPSPTSSYNSTPVSASPVSQPMRPSSQPSPILSPMMNNSLQTPPKPQNVSSVEQNTVLYHQQHQQQPTTPQQIQLTTTPNKPPQQSSTVSEARKQHLIDKAKKLHQTRNQHQKKLQQQMQQLQFKQQEHEFDLSQRATTASYPPLPANVSESAQAILNSHEHVLLAMLSNTDELNRALEEKEDQLSKMEEMMMHVEEFVRTQLDKEKQQKQLMHPYQQPNGIPISNPFSSSLSSTSSDASHDFTFYQNENSLLRHRIEMYQQRLRDLHEQYALSKHMVELKQKKVQDVQEETQMLLQSMRESITEMNTEMKKKEAIMKEEATMLNASLKEMVNVLATENEDLKKQLAAAKTSSTTSTQQGSYPSYSSSASYSSPSYQSNSYGSYSSSTPVAYSSAFSSATTYGNSSYSDSSYNTNTVASSPAAYTYSHSNSTVPSLQTTSAAHSTYQPNYNTALPNITQTSTFQSANAVTTPTAKYFSGNEADAFYQQTGTINNSQLSNDQTYTQTLDLPPPPPLQPQIPAPSIHSLSVIVFSKDRAWQIQQCLKSLLQFIQHDNDVNVNIYVLYTATEKHQKSYQQIQQEYKTVNWIYETISDDANIKPVNFASQLQAVVQTIQSDPSNEAIMFAVDDMLFYEKIDVSEVLHVLRANDSVLNFQLSLFPGLNYCHPANCSVSQPPMFVPCSTLNPTSSHSIVKYLRAMSSSDYNYPFSLCGGIYRINDVNCIIEGIIVKYGEEGINHPNKLEVNGCNWIVQGPMKNSKAVMNAVKGWTACFTIPVCSVITVNCVQTLFNTPIYENQSEIDVSSDGLLELLKEGKEFDIEYYKQKSKQFYSVHIGDFKLKEES